MTRPMRFLVSAVLAIFLAPGVASACAPENADVVYQQLLERLNAERRGAGLPATTLSSALTQAAKAHACDMMRRNFFDHTGSDGSGILQRVQATGYRPCLAAENIAYGQRDATGVMDGWMNSSGHRANILRPEIRDIGVGVAPPVAGQGDGPRWVLVLAAPC